MAKILIVDDDPAIREILRAYLSHEGYELSEAADGVSALALAPAADLVVLDLMLPEMDGLEVARHLRRDLPDLPILMLTARGEEEERVRGFEEGADDYVTKPFSPRELVARVRALLRRSGLHDRLVYGELEIVPGSREVYLAGRPVELSKLEFDLLLTLAQHPGMVFSRERLLERVWGSDFFGVERVVDVHVASLRKRLGDEPDRPRFIETVRGVGYRFKETE
ncbi:response regulator transcription factor [Oceanithermus desulfurans]|uniref:DNA-binding response regulator n=2 Tax=Oceanithermus desulfurans TaxID=227924 RepID=A0A511RL64_9DEIN|nr:response regulator transcription factor [Oceanithermus desulfurans]MBB6029984.1 two-component system alkaline phosphatase synthesis response regulator PhoP [Oceanithermus desulfurans]GEM90399.1 DNA-binding response regulator [Oceanithermus desulfurans NBRC 100063]